MSSSLTCQSRAATASSYESFEERFGFRSWKYFPVTVSISGSEARYMTVSAPFSGERMNGATTAIVSRHASGWFC